MSYDSNNIFAKILRGEIPCIKLYEDAHTLAFMDIMPQTDGHALVIPKEPATTLFELSDAAAQGWVGVGIVPVAATDASSAQEGTLFADLLAGWQSMNSRDEVGHYLDWASPTFYDTLTAALQELMAKQITPEEFAARLQADRAAFLEQLGK